MFDLEGDSGSLIILTGQDSEKPHPIRRIVLTVVLTRINQKM
jgi:hypothetical protein